MVNASDARLLLADDHESAYARALDSMDGIGAVIRAADGVEALEIAAALPLDLAILDFNMARLDGVEAATRLVLLQPTVSVALHSSDPSALRDRARQLDFALFDKIDVEGLLAWLAAQLELRRSPRRIDRQDVSCSRCGYGVAVDPPPGRCPMCNRTADWIPCAPGGWRSRAGSGSSRPRYAIRRGLIRP
jgi:CheY-like chemotaxis protein